MKTKVTLEINYNGLDAADALDQFLNDIRAGIPLSFSVSADDGKVVAFSLLDIARFADAFLLVEPKQTANFALN